MNWYDRARGVDQVGLCCRRRCCCNKALSFLWQVRQSYQTGVSRQQLELERCEEIIKKLMKYRYSWPFR